MPKEGLRSDTVLEQIQRFREQETGLVEEAGIRVLIFRLGDDFFAFPGHQAREILPYHGAAWVPGATDVLPGVVNVRGEVVAVLELKRWLGLGDAGGRFLILLRPGDGRCGVVAEQIVDVTEIPLSRSGPAPATLEERLRRLAASQFEYEDQTVLLLDAVVLLEVADA